MTLKGTICSYARNGGFVEPPAVLEVSFGAKSPEHRSCNARPTLNRKRTLDRKFDNHRSEMWASRDRDARRLLRVLLLRLGAVPADPASRGLL